MNIDAEFRLQLTTCGIKKLFTIINSRISQLQRLVSFPQTTILAVYTSVSQSNQQIFTSPNTLKIVLSVKE